MSTLETRIAEVVSEHAVGAFSGSDTACICDRTWRKNIAYRDHLTKMLAPVIKEAQESAWDELLGKLQSTIGAYTEEGVWALEQASRLNPNPYRADKLVTE